MNQGITSMRKAVFLCFFLVFALRCSLSAQPEPFIETIDRVKLSIVPVACSTWPDKDQTVAIQEIKGTGFFVNYEGYFITAGHVINDWFKWNKHGVPINECFPVIYVPNPTWQAIKWFQFGSCIVDDALDIAVCKTILNPFGVSGLRLQRLSLVATLPKDGTPVAFTGFPQLILVPVTSRANVASSGAFFKADQLDIMIDKTTWHGVSGGPLYLGNGAVIGIVLRAGEGLWTGMAWARQSASVLKFLGDNKVLFWTPEAKNSKENNQKPTKPH